MNPRPPGYESGELVSWSQLRAGDGKDAGQLEPGAQPLGFGPQPTRRGDDPRALWRRTRGRRCRPGPGGGSSPRAAVWMRSLDPRAAREGEDEHAKRATIILGIPSGQRPWLPSIDHDRRVAPAVGVTSTSPAGSFARHNIPGALRRGARGRRCRPGPGGGSSSRAAVVDAIAGPLGGTRGRRRTRQEGHDHGKGSFGTATVAALVRATDR